MTGLNLKTALSRDYSSVIVCREEIRDTTLSFSREWHFSCALACSARSNLADLATEREHQLTTAHANQTTGLTNSRAAN